MKLLATPLITLTFCLGALGATIQMRAQGGAKAAKAAGVERCPSAYIVKTQLIQAGDITVNRSTYACPDNSLREAAQTPLPSTKNIPKQHFGKRAAFDARNAAECRNPAPECQCGQSFQCNCQNVTAQAPESSDCASLVSSTSVIAQAAGPSFTVEPDNFELISFGTCALEWTNFGCSTLEYCWDEFGDTGGVVNQLCFEQGGGTAAACNADDDLWLLQALRVGS
ncbi:uncharacterized protein FOMMEDRAFT_148242 [Fomitiporia mediterranea MF3/22]|uniref:uncharacterized protein n=1 Tax=Fomitiporia mediterranea (strain MF3/22) TaxID=694068 RepID=UPI000440882B|nr:uncharacterized protein FOMMEDRAFT_148242 [Fomitiporia mediterranea MF3/22]EJD00474.1 hypothetical protein FOMMEDRAFT_148242 [Fomitiporia mediterranea MF3/22]